MRKLSLLLVGVSLMGLSLTILKAGQRPRSGTQMIKMRQKEERRALKRMERAARASYKTQRAPRGVRLQRKHELQRQERALRERQRAELQGMKDRQRIYKESLRGH